MAIRHSLWVKSSQAFFVKKKLFHLIHFRKGSHDLVTYFSLVSRMHVHVHIYRYTHSQSTCFPNVLSHLDTFSVFLSPMNFPCFCFQLCLTLLNNNFFFSNIFSDQLPWVKPSIVEHTFDVCAREVKAGRSLWPCQAGLHSFTDGQGFVKALP